LDLGGNDIVGSGNIDIDGYITATGNINLGDGAEDNVIIGGVIESPLIPGADGEYDLGDATARWRSGFFEGLDVDGEIVSLSLRTDDIYKIDSTVLFSAENDLFNANVKGSIINQDDVTIVDAVNNSAVFENLEADNIFGSIYNDDSTLMLDNRASIINVENVIAGQLESPRIITPIDLTIQPTQTGRSSLRILGKESSPEMLLIKQDNNLDLSGTSSAYGRLVFSRDDINGEAVGSLITGNDFRIVQGVPLNGTFEPSNFCTWTGTGLGVGKLDANETLDVEGNAVASGFVQFGSFTTTERDEITAANGMVIYNTTDNKFQGYQADTWINLDGS
jgi:hypothetical protein